jgi:hypothetical protein
MNGRMSTFGKADATFGLHMSAFNPKQTSGLTQHLKPLSVILHSPPGRKVLGLHIP